MYKQYNNTFYSLASKAQFLNIYKCNSTSLLAIRKNYFPFQISNNVLNINPRHLLKCNQNLSIPTIQKL